MPDLRPVAFGLRVYRAIARAYPHEFKNVYGDEILGATEESVEDVWKHHGYWGLLRLLLDFAVRVPLEHLSELQQDVHYGVRSLVSSPGFSLVALISLTLGICVATCAFSEMNGIALRDLPAVRSPRELVVLELPVSYPAYKRFRGQTGIFSATMAYAAPVPFALSIGGGSTDRTWGHLVSSTYFSTLGVHPALGSLFDAANEAGDPMPQIVVSYRFWHDRLSHDSSAIGKILRVNGHACTIIGVAPKEFLGASPLLFPADLWMHVSTGSKVTPELADNGLERNDLSMFFVVGRLRPGVGTAAAEAALDTVASQLEAEQVRMDPVRRHRRVLLVEGGRMLPLRKQDLPFFTSFLAIMAVLIMAIACANIANMMLARAARRRKEIAIRLSLGASRIRLIRQLLTESTVLAVLAGVLGYAGSSWLMTISSQVRMPFPMPVAYDFRPDGHVLLLTAVLCLVTGVVFGLAPALQATKADVVDALKKGDTDFMAARRRLSLRNLLIVSQVAGSLTLLVLLGVLSLGIQTTLGVQAGFNSERLYSIALDPARDGYDSAHASVFFDRVLNRVRALPAVTSASLTETLPVSMAGARMLTSDPAGGNLTVSANKNVVGKGYFETAGIRVSIGRGFHAEDEMPNSTAVVVSETLATALWGAADPVGRPIEIRNGEATPSKVIPGSFDHRPTVREGGQTFQVVGVAVDVANGLTVGKPLPAVYFPLHPYDYSHPPLQGITLLLRGAPGADVLSVVHREIAAIDDRVTPFNGRSMAEQINQFMSPLRSAAWTYALIGIFGVVLACVGIAGVTAYSVVQRSREIGIRMALGARTRQVLSLVMKEGLSLVTAGTVVGMAGAWSGTRFLASMNASVGTVTSTSSSDPVVLVGAPLLLAAVSFLACYLPARRSTRVNPVVVLRQE
ncbi:MAG TPA: ADOP family duplicated permease [Bryobacteraceae bacterium]|nr:ADOP family duplicated permease [Bryobacteraceae bacterium]